IRARSTIQASRRGGRTKSPGSKPIAQNGLPACVLPTEAPVPDHPTLRPEPDRDLAVHFHAATSSSGGPGRVAGFHAESLRIVERQHVLAHGRENSPGRFAIPIVPPGVIASDAVTGVRVAPGRLGAQPCRSNPLSRPKSVDCEGTGGAGEEPEGATSRVAVAPSSARNPTLSVCPRVPELSWCS